MFLKLNEEIEKYNNNNEYSKIIDLINSLDEEEKDFEILKSLAQAQINLGNYEKGFSILNSAKHKDEYDPLWNYLIGCSLNGLGKYERALQYLQKSKKFGKYDMFIFAEIGFSLGKLKEFQDSLNYLKKAKELGNNENWIEEMIELNSKKINSTYTNLYDEKPKHFLKKELNELKQYLDKKNESKDDNKIIKKQDLINQLNELEPVVSKIYNDLIELKKELKILK